MNDKDNGMLDEKREIIGVAEVTSIRTVREWEGVKKSTAVILDDATRSDDSVLDEVIVLVGFEPDAFRKDIARWYPRHERRGNTPGWLNHRLTKEEREASFLKAETEMLDKMYTFFDRQTILGLVECEIEHGYTSVDYTRIIPDELRSQEAQRLRKSPVWSQLQRQLRPSYVSRHKRRTGDTKITNDPGNALSLAELRDALQEWTDVAHKAYRKSREDCRTAWIMKQDIAAKLLPTNGDDEPARDDSNGGTGDELDHERIVLTKKVKEQKRMIKALRRRDGKPSRSELQSIIDENRFESSGKANLTKIGDVLGRHRTTAKEWIKEAGLSDYAGF